MDALFDGSYKPHISLANEETHYHDDDDVEVDATLSGTGQRRHELMPLYSDHEELDATSAAPSRGTHRVTSH